MVRQTPPMVVEAEIVDTETPATVPATTDNGGGTVATTIRPGRLSYAEMAQQAEVVIEGFDLVKGKESLIGVPFAVIGVTYRDGISEGEVRRVNYLSIELLTCDAKTLGERVQRGSVPLPVIVGPEEMLVINDGSTGIARQVTEILHWRGIIDIGPVGEETGGEMGQSPYDRYRDDWVAGKEKAEEGIKGYPLFLCPRGLRVSEYDLPGTKKKSKTFYLG